MRRPSALLDTVRTMTIDNPVQQLNVAELRELLSHRLSILQDVIDQKKTDNIYSLEDLQKGKYYMDQVRQIVRRMQGIEHDLQTTRIITQMKKFAGYTPILVAFRRHPVRPNPALFIPAGDQ